MNNKTISALETAGIYIILAVVAVAVFYPLLWAVSISFNTGTSLYSSTLIPSNPSFEHYKWLFASPESHYVTWYKNTLIVSACNSLFSVILTSVMAYVFSRFRFVGRKSGLYTFLLLQMFPVMMAMVAIYIFLNLIGLLDSLAGLILIYLGGQIPFNVWLVKGYLDTLPHELDDAAKIDGAGPLKTFYRILLPLSAPILAIVALNNFMMPIFDFVLPSIILHDPDNYTIAVGLYQFVADEYGNNFTRFTAGAILIALPIALIYLVLQRFLISGLAAGGTKG